MAQGQGVLFVCEKVLLPHNVLQQGDVVDQNTVCLIAKDNCGKSPPACSGGRRSDLSCFLLAAKRKTLVLKVVNDAKNDICPQT